MPLITYECDLHGEFEKVLFGDENKPEFPCPECSKLSKRVIVMGHGGVIVSGDAKDWVRGVSETLDPDRESPMETIEDLRKFYDEHPNIAPKESHPSFPSSIGDIEKPQNRGEYLKERRNMAMEYLRKDEALTLTTEKSV